MRVAALTAPSARKACCCRVSRPRIRATSSSSRLLTLLAVDSICAPCGVLRYWPRAAVSRALSTRQPFVVWALAVESIIAVIKPRVGIYLPFAAFQQLTFGGSVGAEGSSGLPTLTQPEAFLVAIAYIAVFSVAAVFISLRREVT